MQNDMLQIGMGALWLVRSEPWIRKSVYTLMAAQKHCQPEDNFAFVLSDPIQEQRGTGSRCSKPPPRLEQHPSLSLALALSLSLSLRLFKFAFRLFSASDRFNHVWKFYSAPKKGNERTPKHLYGSLRFGFPEVSWGGHR